MAYGHLASEIGLQLPLQVLKSGAGYYIGTYDDDNGPVSRESVEYWPEKADAIEALATGGWTQRVHSY
jgi:hypothetical protein